MTECRQRGRSAYKGYLWALLGERKGLEPDRDAAEEAAAHVVGVAGRRGRLAAAAQLHVELHRPVGGEVEEDVEILRQHELEALDLVVGGRRRYWLAGLAERLELLIEPVEGHED